MAAGSRLYNFRYPYDVQTAMEPWRKHLAGVIEGGADFDTVVALLADRDRSLEDYLSFMSQGRLAYAISTSLTLFTTNNASTDLAGLSVTVSVPANRVLRVTGQAAFINTNNGAASLNYDLSGWINSDGSDTGYFGDLSAQIQPNPTTVSVTLLQSGSIIVTPTAGSHTYKLVGKTSATGAGTSAIGGAALTPAFILVEDIGPVNP